jgi:hypothetical protein
MRALEREYLRRYPQREIDAWRLRPGARMRTATTSRAQIGIGTNDAPSSDLQAVRVQASVASGLLARAAFKQVRKRA